MNYLGIKQIIKIIKITIIIIFIASALNSLLETLYYNLAAQTLLNGIIRYDQKFYDRLILDIEPDHKHSEDRNYERAEALASLALDYKVTPQGQLVRILALLGQKWYSEAINEIKSNPGINDKELLVFWKGIAFEKSGDIAQAIELWRQIGFPVHLLIRMNYYLQQGDIEQVKKYALIASEICNNADCRDSDIANIWGQIGWAARSEGRYEEAIDAYQQAIFYADLPQYQEGLALSLWYASKLDEARFVFFNLYNMYPELPQYSVWLGKLHEDLGDLKSAEEYLINGLNVMNSYDNEWPFHEAASFYARQKNSIKVNEIMAEVIAGFPERVCENIKLWDLLISQVGEGSDAFTETVAQYQAKCNLAFPP
jgi:tetratricopeptide (TPR) repeat protein